jgi:hypothetical protein
VAKEEAFESVPGAGAISDGVAASPSEIADRFVGGVRHMDGGELAGAVQASKLNGVASIRLQPHAAAVGDFGGGDNDAVDAVLLQPTVENITGGACFVGYVQLDGVGADLADQLVDGV